MVDHVILPRHLQLSCGISNTLFLWFKSYLSDHSKMVVVGDSTLDLNGSALDSAYLLFPGLNPTYLIFLWWFSLRFIDLNGSGLDLAYLRAQDLDLSSICSIVP